MAASAGVKLPILGEPSGEQSARGPSAPRKTPAPAHGAPGPISARRERRGLATEGETNPAGAIEADPIRHLMTHITPCRSAPLTCGNAARLLETAP